MIRHLIKGTAVVVVGGGVLITTPAGKAALSLIRRAAKLVPALAKIPGKKEFLKLLITSTI